MKLEIPDNFTGYDSEPISFNKFKENCYNAVLGSQIKVSNFIEPKYPNNYFGVCLKAYDDEIYFLVNSYTGLSGFCKRSGDNWKFLASKDIPSNLESLSSNYKVLIKEQLELDIDSNNVICRVMQKPGKLRQWLPSNVGSLLFSWYFD